MIWQTTAKEELPVWAVDGHLPVNWKIFAAKMNEITSFQHQADSLANLWQMQT